MKHTILFVDDEPNILMGLKRMLRGMREEWEMIFANSGPEALEIMAKQKVDAVVSDMRMPGMDGPELLRRVQKEYPEAVRFALSGFSDQEMVGRSIAPTHQYLTKPCDEKQLVAALARALGMRVLVPNKAIMDKLLRVEHLPVLPEAYNRITAELAKGDPSPKIVGDIVAHDVSLTANILKLVNSAYFGLPMRIGSPQQAVNVLGVSVIRSVILTLHIFESFQSTQAGFSMDMLRAHSMRAGAMARALATLEKLPQEQAEDASVAAMLHDVGKLLMAAFCPEESRAVLAAVHQANRRVEEIERELLGLTHAQVGAYLLGLWGLPEQIVRAVAAHHDPEPPHGGSLVDEVVAFANHLDHEIFVFNEHYARPKPSAARLAAIGGEERLARWQAAMLELDLGKEKP